MSSLDPRGPSGIKGHALQWGKGGENSGRGAKRRRGGRSLDQKSWLGLYS